MFGLSYGEIFLLIGATAALIGPKDLPVIARTAGRLAGRAIGYVQVARGHFDSVMQQSQARQVHKELQDAMAQLDAIRYEIRSISIMNHGPMTKKLMDSAEASTSANGTGSTSKTYDELSTKSSNDLLRSSIVQRDASAPESDGSFQTTKISKETNSDGTNSASLHSQAMNYARLAKSPTVRAALSSPTGVQNGIADAGLLNILPVSAESAGLLPNRIGEAKGSDIVLEAIIEAEVAHNAKDFFAQPQNQIHSE